MNDALRDQLQTTLGDSYTLERELGGGGMSRVFVAEETRHRRTVVIKVLSPELMQGISVERFEREIQTAAATPTLGPGIAVVSFIANISSVFSLHNFRFQ